MVSLKLSDLSLGYNAQRVAYINQLAFESPKLYFIIGRSGIGKSTLLEFLGLMNNTSLDQKGTLSLSTEDEDFPVHSFWTASDQDISAFRNTYFSFIFQNTNLLDNYSVGENIILPQLFDGKELTALSADAKSAMERLHLPKALFNKPVNKLSGGQRQRVAFLRAFSTPFSILLGDEPTGNLDPALARTLISILKKELVEKQAIGIIVSHDLELALQYADVIMAFEEKDGLGTVLENGIVDMNNCDIDQVRKDLLAKFQNPEISE